MDKICGHGNTVCQCMIGKLNPLQVEIESLRAENRKLEALCGQYKTKWDMCDASGTRYFGELQGYKQSILDQAECIEEVKEFLEQAPFDFHNGNTDPTGYMDEGDVLGNEFLGKLIEQVEECQAKHKETIERLRKGGRRVGDLVFQNNKLKILANNKGLKVCMLTGGKYIWIQYEEFFNQSDKIDNQYQLIEKLLEVVEFYGNEKSWITKMPGVCDLIHEKDLEQLDDSNDLDWNTGGKKARAILQTDAVKQFRDTNK